MTMGEGGCVYTNDPLLNRLIRSYRDWGRDCSCAPGVDNRCGHRFDGWYGELPVGYDHKYVYSHFGYNLKLTDMQAAVGCEQFKKLPFFIERRRRNWQQLNNALSDGPAAQKLILPEAAENSSPSWFDFLISVRNGSGLERNELTHYLEEHNIQTRLLFSGNLIRHPCFDRIRGTDAYRVAGKLTNTDFVMTNVTKLSAIKNMTDEVSLGDEHHQELFQLIQQYTDEDDQFIVYGNEDSFYFYSHRFAASRFSFQYPIILVDEEMRESFFAELDEKMPTLILVQSLWCNDEYIQEFLETHPYQCITDFEDYALYLKEE